MKEERMAILSMVEKGIITVDEAATLLNALNGSKGEGIEKFMSKAGEKLNVFAKTVGEKTEKLVNDAKPLAKATGEKMEKVVDDMSPSIKKAAGTFTEKANEIKEKIKERRGTQEEEVQPEPEMEDTDEVTESDFEEDVKIIPIEEAEKKEEAEEKTEE